MRGIVSHCPSLFGGFIRARDDKLIFERLNPEARREISEVGNESDEGASGEDSGPAFTELAIEVRNHGKEQISGILAPKVLEKRDERAMEKADGGLEDAEEMRAAKGPAVLKEDVVLLLNANAGEFAEDVEAIGEVLELDEMNVPGTALLGGDGLQSDSGVAVPPSGVMENDKNFLHETDCGMGMRGERGARFMPCGKVSNLRVLKKFHKHIHENFVASS